MPSDAPITGRNPQSPTHWDDDEPESLEELRINLHKDRRSGLERRAVDPDSARNFRQEVEREYRAEIRQLREEAHAKDQEIRALENEITQIKTWQHVHEPTLSAAIMIVNAGLVFRYVIVGIVGITAAVGGVSAMMEAIKSWLSR